jgi:hypothetical protein
MPQSFGRGSCLQRWGSASPHRSKPNPGSASGELCFEVAWPRLAVDTAAPAVAERPRHYAGIEGEEARMALLRTEAHWLAGQERRDPPPPPKPTWLTNFRRPSVSGISRGRPPTPTGPGRVASAGTPCPHRNRTRSIRQAAASVALRSPCSGRSADRRSRASSPAPGPRTAGR